MYKYVEHVSWINIGWRNYYVNCRVAKCIPIMTFKLPKKLLQHKDNCRRLLCRGILLGCVSRIFGPFNSYYTPDKNFVCPFVTGFWGEHAEDDFPTSSDSTKQLRPVSMISHPRDVSDEELVKKISIFRISMGNHMKRPGSPSQFE